eukprot:TRINITY_DN36997_c1_g2_i1.p3 TRINITY_DN36997_c1_g2~~TRINITY_DN36997_c1_g2_i1.p3  ORF type:complete len:113 (-),score=23.65 TRINITY_DN36997_c1_g2_i1:391-729(-)
MMLCLHHGVRTVDPARIAVLDEQDRELARRMRAAGKSVLFADRPAVRKHDGLPAIDDQAEDEIAAETAGAAGGRAGEVVDDAEYAVRRRRLEQVSGVIAAWCGGRTETLADP